MRLLKKIIFIVAVVLIILFLISLIVLLFAKENYKYPNTWTKYKNAEYGFSIKHPYFLGNYLGPARFTNDFHCNNSNPPPKPYFNINNDSENFPETNSEGEYLYEKEYSFLIGSGECIFMVNDQGPRLISVYVFENEYSNIKYDEYLEKAYKQYVERFEKSHRWNMEQEEENKWNTVKTTLGDGNLFYIQPDYPEKRDLVYYQKLHDNKILIITVARESRDHSGEVFLNMVKMIKTF